MAAHRGQHNNLATTNPQKNDDNACLNTIHKTYSTQCALAADSSTFGSWTTRPSSVTPLSSTPSSTPMTSPARAPVEEVSETASRHMSSSTRHRNNTSSNTPGTCQQHNRRQHCTLLPTISSNPGGATTTTRHLPLTNNKFTRHASQARLDKRTSGELKLARHCLGESKVQHFLRMYGADLLPELAHAGTTADTQLNSIATGMTDFSRQHASLGIRIGGLRRRKDLATPAELAAKLTVRPQMADLSAALTVAGLAPDKQLLKRFDSNNQVLHIDFEAQLGLIEKQKRPALVQQITLISKNEWERVRHGHPINAPPPSPLHPGTDYHNVSMNMTQLQRRTRKTAATNQQSTTPLLPATGQNPGQSPPSGIGRTCSSRRH